LCKSCANEKMQERLYEVPACGRQAKYNVPRSLRSKSRETCLPTGRQETRLICLVSRVSYFYDFLLGTWYFVLGIRVGSEKKRLKWWLIKRNPVFFAVNFLLALILSAANRVTVRTGAVLHGGTAAGEE